MPLQVSICLEDFNGINAGGWQSFMAEDIVSRHSLKELHGREAYMEDAGRFFGVVKSVKVLQLIIDGDTACAVANYKLKSPEGNAGTCDIAEVLSVRHGETYSSTIFLDTLAFKEFIAPFSDSYYVRK